MSTVYFKDTISIYDQLIFIKTLQLQIYKTILLKAGVILKLLRFFDVYLRKRP